jgi:glycosyltransferase involved in cell wall biosynthesis
MKIAMVVHGRFHAFDLARAVIERGHVVALLTNYPAWAVERFGVPRRHVRSFWPHGVLARAAWRLREKYGALYPEAALHRLFGRWAAAQLSKERWDVMHLWSGVAEESLRAAATGCTLRLLMRGSAHIRAQARLLEEEERRTGAPQDRPSAWMIAREEREYALADTIAVLSTFARRTFLAEGVPSHRLGLLPLGARLSAFRPPREVVEARCRRILDGATLRVLYVGAISFQKGLWDLAAVVRELSASNFDFRLVGPRPAEAAAAVASLAGLATVVPRQPQAKLPDVYLWGDVFVFPTIQDGYATVLAQAAASALPILATTNCSGPDLIRDGENGWVVPIRSPEALIERLRWCDTHRQELADMVRRIYEKFQPRDWANVAADFEALCRAKLEAEGS